MKDWTEQDRARIGAFLMDGLSASQIGNEMGVTRNAIIGLVHRDKNLRAIGFARKGGGNNGGGRPRKHSAETVKERARERARAHYWRQKAHRKAKAKAANPPKPAVSIEEWLRLNGGPRRFERGFSTDYFNIRQYLIERGIRIENHQNRLKLYEGNRPRIVSWEEVHAMVDEFRIAEGLTPIIQRAA